MRRIVRTLGMTAVALMLHTAAPAGGATWVDRDGAVHDLEGREWKAFVDAVDLADLRDGETRTFGSGERQVVATRDGDEVRLERAAAAPGDRDLLVTCRVDRDRCLVRSGPEGRRVAIRIEKSRHASEDDPALATVHLEHLGGTGDGHVVVLHRTDDCGEGEECEDVVVQGPGGTGQVVVGRMELSGGGEGPPALGDVWVHAGADGVLALSEHGDIEVHDLAEELLDGETRIFGSGDDEVVAVREGDTIRLSRKGSDRRRAVDTECRIGTDRCRVLTFADDPERVVVVVRKERRCRDAEGDCADEGVRVLGSGPGDTRVIVIDDSPADAPSSKRRVRVRREL